MTSPGTVIRVTGGPYYPTCHDLPGVVRHHAPGTYTPATFLVGGAMVTADLLPGEIEVGM